MLKTKIILIVDDDEDDRELFCEAIGQIDPGLKCEHAQDGIVALEYLADHEQVLPDFIFLDLNMPRFNGKQFLAEIKKTEHLKKIPVIIYSTSNNEHDRVITQKLGASGFLHKPTEFRTLCSELRKWVC